MAVKYVQMTVDDGNSSAAQHPPAIQQSLKSYWGPVDSQKPADFERANKFKDLHATRNTHLSELSNLELPSEDDFLEMIMKAKHSACGEDGVHYGAYKVNSFLSVAVLYNSFGDLASGSPSTDLTASKTQLDRFAPKVASGDDRVAVIRTPNDLRTIFGSKCDSKFTSGTILHKLVNPTLQVTPQNQRGFCKGRQLSLNTVDLDLFMRLFNCKIDISKISMDKVGNIPVSVLYDFRNAFPIVLHCFLFNGLAVSCVHTLHRNSVMGLYIRTTAYSSGIGDGPFFSMCRVGLGPTAPLVLCCFIVYRSFHKCIWLVVRQPWFFQYQCLC